MITIHTSLIEITKTGVHACTHTHTQIIEGETRRERDKRRGGGGGEEEETRYNMTISTCLPTCTCTRRQNEQIL